MYEWLCMDDRTSFCEVDHERPHCVCHYICCVGHAGSIALSFGRLFGVYTIVRERRCHVYVFFGKVVEIIDEPGLHFLWPLMDWKAFVVNWLGKCYVLDMRLDQVYLRSAPVNSEEGAPMESESGTKCLSAILSLIYSRIWIREDRCRQRRELLHRALPQQSSIGTHDGKSSWYECHGSRRVSPTSDEWGYRLGSVYIRKVHFRDKEMIRQIESKVVNRLRQVTSAIKQDGANQVSIITSTADRKAAIEFAKAARYVPSM